MRHLAALVALVLSAGVGIGVGCAAGGSNNETTGGGGGQGGESGPGSTGPGGPGSTGSGAGGAGGSGGGGPMCAKFSAEAKQLPAAMLVVLDMSASMKKAQKWGTAQLAVVSAIDKDVFDS